MTEHRPLDLICLGRAAVDFYAQQLGARLEDAGSFAKYLGGSSANVCYGAARLGLRSAMLSCVGDDHMGRFVREELARAGVDVSHLRTDAERLTALVVLGIKDKDTFPLIFYRENCADMALEDTDADADFIASSRALAITGTHFSTARTDRVCRQALARAQAANTLTILDIDYRPVLWGLTGRGDGETRYIAADGVTAHLQSLVGRFDLIVGTEEEFHIAGGSTDTLAALRAVRALSEATLVLKRGAAGCQVFAGELPGHLDDAPLYGGFQVPVLNVLGAGDAFLAGFLRGWLRGESAQTCARFANACGALVVSRHGCAPAMPTAVELEHYLAQHRRIPLPDRDAQLTHLHRVTTRPAPERPTLFALAFDHRPQFRALAMATGSPPQRIGQLKGKLLEAALSTGKRLGLGVEIGVLIDDTYGQDALDAATGRGLWIGRPVEIPGSRPLELEGGRSIGSRLITWPLEHVVKCLVHYHPDDPIDLRLAQERQVQELYQACLASGHELLLEVIPPKNSACDNDTLRRAVQRFYHLGIRPDWWKLPPMPAAAWTAVGQVIHQFDPYCRGMVMLGLDQPQEALIEAISQCAGVPGCVGFAVGRTLFMEASRRWLLGEVDDAGLIEDVGARYEQLIHAWRRAGGAREVA